MDAGGASQPITQSAEDAQASSVICKEETNSRDLPDSSTSAHLGDCLKDEDAEKKFDAEASSRNLFSNNNAGPFISVNQSGSVQFIPSQQRYETFSSWPGSPIMQYAVRSRNGTYIVSDIKGQATPGGMSAYQISSPASGLSQVMDSSPSSLPSPQKLAEEASRKRELRLMKNREAARECRRKKKEYVKCLENRVAVLEKQNKMLIEELKALKDLYCHKTE
ncbi:cAMP responsive element modulator b isoform X2 [Megalobrama amblycephala]|uniref:cAMP responsive element modulator b isoform X2 n=1 Tax=Megalobrama amblycephala TaxID=75352 RepID=UPI0020143835|nr:cAMP responsive element modulator b isoform X2 [Megalobrama amblycephala]